MVLQQLRSLQSNQKLSGHLVKMAVGTPYAMYKITRRTQSTEEK